MTLLGVPYPLTKTSRGYFFSAKDTNVLKADIIQLLMTNPGERVMMPEYGTGLRRLIFEQADKTLATAARELIIAAFNRWEPRPAVTSLNTSIDEEQNLLMISIEFVDPENIQQVEVLELEVPI